MTSQPLLDLERSLPISDLSTDLDELYSHLEEEAIKEVNAEARKMEDIINGGNKLL